MITPPDRFVACLIVRATACNYLLKTEHNASGGLV